MPRLIFIVLALALVALAYAAYHHDEELRQKSMQINLGDPNEFVREILGNPSSEGACGSMTAVPKGCADEYVYRFYYSVFQPQFEVVWFDSAGKVLGLQHVQRP